MKRRTIYILIALAPFVCIFAALFMGRFSVSFSSVVGSLVGGVAQLVGGAGEPENIDHASYVLVTQARLPRALAAAMVGAALAISGAAYQGVFRNPLVNPGLLGVSSGASFGAALAIVFLGGGLAIYPAAFLLGLAAVALSWWISRVYKQSPAIMLILGGTIVSSVFSALVSLMKYVADPVTQLPDIVYWLMGSLASVGWDQMWAAVPIVLGVALIVSQAWHIDLLSMGDREARSLGVDVGRSKALVIAGATLATAGAVCVCGVVGWVGLVMPHIGRMLVGSRNRALIPASAALGAAFMVVVDTAARCLVAGELPLGILTALVGAPFFVYLLKKTKGGNWA